MIGMQETLAGLFAIDIVGNATMDNHIHCLLRNRPDVVDRWSDTEVVIRWLQITKLKISGDILPAIPKEVRIEEELAKGAEHLLRLRNRLSDISWFMAALSENISRRINAEENRTGTCWQGRFKSKVTCDENTALLMLMYIELNPIRARIAELLEDSDQSSAGLRLRALIAKKNGQPFASNDYRAALWLSELELDQSKSVDDPSFFQSTTGKRASDKGVLGFSQELYFQMLDWAAREVRADKRGSTPEHIQPILERLGWTDDQVIELLRGRA
jgi:REP element-mobilizing transposase RayT